MNLAGVTGIDAWDDGRILESLMAGQERAIAAVRAALPRIAEAAAAIAPRILAGGRLIYAGAGTSIRVAVQDGTELPETFGMDRAQLSYLIAGGREAMFTSAGAGEDDVDAAARDAAICGPGDALIAVAASGTTPYTIAAAEKAKAAGTLVVAVVNNPGSPLGAVADIEIVLDSGPEVVAGSTRMGAGTAQKAALNLISTLSFIKLGAVHDGMMVNVRASNTKLKHRARGIVMRITGVAEARAAEALDQAAGEIKAAALLCAGAKDLDTARHLLTATNGSLRLALARLSAP